ncbi:MAG TPA: N-acetylmuramoyl-L-alanine amidase [Bryobacteraceae bacterium]|nr:N-acetylmuramoyl-L-alanine amidase [Bryobacteraceae bacterium]HPT25145.1 N-acetylmuramoyl-L-alanine amidase [Bryobacteraceae bacterium]
MTTYTIVPGDTLYSIAQRLGVPLHLLIEVNDIAGPTLIKPGQLLSVPSITTDSSDHPEPPASEPPLASPIAIDQATLRLPPSGYIAERHPKDLIVLHFTAGPSARSAFNTWAGAAARVATAYILDIDGTVFETFDPSCWAYHLGIKGAASANHCHDKRSIGIEIANVGPLKPNAAGDLCWWPPQNRFGRKLCSLDDRHLYVKTAFRGFEYYASYTEAQIQALSPLIEMLRRRFNIPAQLPEPGHVLTADPAGYFKDFRGIAGHQNFRADKLDVGPAFPWTRITL